MIVVIPSLEPDRRLPDLVADIRRELVDARVLVVDDGSGTNYAPIFQDARDRGASVIGYERNRGKGYALRTAFEWCLKNAPGHEVVCADSDGQHRPKDIVKVASAVRTNPKALVLGVRAFTGRVPARSRFGNWMSAQFFRLASGVKVGDTQTGLRGYGHEQLASLVDVPGDRFEWELNALLAAADAKREIVQVPIDTVYIDENSSSHFRPIQDSWRVFRPLLAFAGAGVFCWVLEFGVFLFLAANVNLLTAVIASRIISGVVNFGINKMGVFRERSKERTWHQAGQYTALAIFLIGVTYVGVRLLTAIGVPTWLAKITTDVAGFILSFTVQRRLIFRSKGAQEKRRKGESRQESLRGAWNYAKAPVDIA
ncbi:MAG: bifunctional glycosyltransferase family 2/GtrA family protein [Actinomycetaceae bacterium]|nr:bifunctional glycosyltransferase family 2/GtrA family protein [Actinomycetaceae bacterium]